MVSPTQNNVSDVKAEVNIILKVVDQCIKAGLLEDAKSHLEKARLLDPSNAYVYAFEERISFLEEEKKKRDAAISSRAAMEDAVRARLEAERRRAEEERLKREAENLKKLEETRVKRGIVDASVESVPYPKSSAPIVEKSPIDYIAPKSKDTVTQQQRVENKQTQQATSAPSPVSTSTSQATVRTSSQSRDMYKRVLLLAWADGAISPEEQIRLEDLRKTLHITTEEHIQLEMEAKEESYSHALSIVLNTGMNAKERSIVVNELMRKYQISPDIHSKIEAKLLGPSIVSQAKPLLYVIDDDENFLLMLVKILENGGYSVKSYTTSDEALIGLKNDTPDLIISDINLETSTIGGFSFYEKVRQLHHLIHVPFIFLSGMTDEGMVRYGKSLGVDDYITKPFTSEMLLDTIKGKIKRYKQLKNT